MACQKKIDHFCLEPLNYELVKTYTALEFKLINNAPKYLASELFTPNTYIGSVLKNFAPRLKISQFMRL